MTPEDRRDVITGAACFGVLGLYTLWSVGRRVMTGLHPTTRVRRAWISETMATPEDSLLVVQTMRNLIIAGRGPVWGGLWCSCWVPKCCPRRAHIRAGRCCRRRHG